jgi:hypothetical protein
MASNNLLIAMINPLQVLKKDEPNSITEDAMFEKDVAVVGKVLSDTAVGVKDRLGGCFEIGIDSKGAILQYSNPDVEKQGFRFEGASGQTIAEVSAEGEAIFHTNGKVGAIIHSPSDKTYNSIRGLYGSQEGWFVGKAPDTTNDAHFYNNIGGGLISLTQSGVVELTPSGKNPLTVVNSDLVATGNLYSKKSISIVNSDNKLISINLTKDKTIGDVLSFGDPTGVGTSFKYQNGLSDIRLITNGNLSSKSSSVESVATIKNTDVIEFSDKVLDKISSTTVSSYKDGKNKEQSLGFSSIELSKTLPLSVISIMNEKQIPEQYIDLAALCGYLICGMREVSALISGLSTSGTSVTTSIADINKRCDAIDARLHNLETKSNTYLIGYNNRLLRIETDNLEMKKSLASITQSIGLIKPIK